MNLYEFSLTHSIFAKPQKLRWKNHIDRHSRMHWKSSFHELRWWQFRFSTLVFETRIVAIVMRTDLNQEFLQWFVQCFCCKPYCGVSYLVYHPRSLSLSAYGEILWNGSKRFHSMWLHWIMSNGILAVYIHNLACIIMLLSEKVQCS